MSPDTQQSQIARLQQQVAALEGQVAALAPFLRDQAVLADRLGRLQQDVDKFGDVTRTKCHELEARMDKARDQREREREEQMLREQAREDRERKENFLRWTTLATLLFVFISTSVAIVALVVH